MVTHWPSGIPSRPVVRLSSGIELLKRFQSAAHNARAYQRWVASKGAAGGAQPATRPCGPPVIGGVSAGVSRPPANGVALAGSDRPPVNGGAASAARSSEIAVLIAVQVQMRAM
jgi:hypothetical protein